MSRNSLYTLQTMTSLKYTAVEKKIFSLHSLELIMYTSFLFIQWIITKHATQKMCKFELSLILPHLSFISIFLFCFAVLPFPLVFCLYDVPNFVLRGQGVYCWLEFKICRMFNSLKENIHSFPCRKSLTNCCPNHGVERHIWSATAVCNRSSFTFENTLFHRF